MHILYSFDFAVKRRKVKPMKRTIFASLILAVLMVGLPFAELLSDGKEEDPPAPTKAEYAETESDEALRLKLLGTDGQIVELSADEYLVGVVSAEMPVSFEAEALKAQSVAARSYLRRCLEQGSRHDGADICASSACCQAYKSESELRELWGDGYDERIEKIKAAVKATDGEYLSYEGAAILAAFHSSSSGKTEEAAELWSDVPYLVSVSSPEDEKTVPDFVSTLALGEIDFRDTLLHLHPEADFSVPADEWIGEVRHTNSGRVQSIVLGGVSFTGSEIRELFSLRSTAFEIKRTADGFSFTVTGYGHGVGMSQYGANVMAKEGKSYREILAHYYPETTLVIPVK